jgi:hypothetical protein
LGHGAATDSAHAVRATYEMNSRCHSLGFAAIKRYNADDICYTYRNLSPMRFRQHSLIINSFIGSSGVAAAGWR